MCGIIGIFNGKYINQQIYDGLIAMQHRGQDAVGMITYNGQFHLKKGLGLVRDIFDERNMSRLHGKWGLGQVRYPTVAGAAKNRIEDVQPFYVNSPFGISIVHNGNIFNFDELKKELFDKDKRHINSDCDSEALLNILAFELDKEKFNDDEFVKHFFSALKRVFARLKGSYSVIGMIADKGMFAFRDPYGIKPLVIGKKDESYIVASENIMFPNLDYKLIRDLQPGEAIFIDPNGELHSNVIKQKGYNPCVFEYIYFARPDALLDNVLVYKSRLRMGQFLAKKINEMSPKWEIDVVIPVPATANTTAMALAHDIGVKYREGLVKNHSIGRTFIMPGQKERTKSIKRKLAPVELEIRDKNVLLVDDSIVRGNTSKGIVDLVRNSGAKKIFFASAAPPLRYPCLYGIDLPTKLEFIANESDSEAVCQAIGADSLIYQDLDDLVASVVQYGNPPFDKPCTACFNGDYPAGGGEVIN